MAQNKINKYNIVAIGGSAGSFDVLMKIVAELPEKTHASFIIVVHRKNSPDTILAQLLSIKTTLPVKEVEDKDVLKPGCIYIASPDYHLLIEDKHQFSLDSSEKINYSRPSIDVTFECVAEVFRSAAIGVLLSGANADGAVGLQKIKEYGGYTIAQDPSSADVGYMPQQAIDTGNVDAILHADEIAAFIKKLLLTPV